MLRWIADRYGNPPVYITENGCSDPESGAADPLNDPERAEFIRGYVREALRAKDTFKTDRRGYFYWSLLDNFEWTSGYRRHFGLLRCTPTEPERRPKKSFAAYRELIRENRTP